MWPDLTKGVALEQLSSESYNSTSHSLASFEQLSDNVDKEDLKICHLYVTSTAEDRKSSGQFKEDSGVWIQSVGYRS